MMIVLNKRVTIDITFVLSTQQVYRRVAQKCLLLDCIGSTITIEQVVAS